MAKKTDKQNTKVRFDPKSFEDDVRDFWRKKDVYATGAPNATGTKQTTDSKSSSEETREKEYILVMFPYPSGAGLHTGHARIYTGTDVLARYYRMKGKNVLHPMGWDAFGLPAEQYAMKHDLDPADVTSKNVKRFKEQFDLLGISYDWDKEIDTTDPTYYAITQWLFLKFFKAGMLYREETTVNWCPALGTVLANEEVINGRSERGDHPVYQKKMSQWIFNITRYAESLLEGLDEVDWPNGIIEMQRNWIGKKEGVNITYPVDGADEDITCFTTRPDTNYGATFIVLAPEHDLVEKIIQGEIDEDVFDGDFKALQKDVSMYQEEALKKSERERKAEDDTKSGVFTGLYAVNRLNGEKLPVWVSDFVLASVGTGAVVGVPAHDKRDYAFAATFDLPVKRVVKSPESDRSESDTITHVDEVFEDYGVAVNSDKINGLSSEKAQQKISDIIEDKGWGSREITYHLRDWIFSRQRYWGEPIPMVFCSTCAEKGVGYLDNHKAPNGFGVPAKVRKSLKGWYPLSEEKLPLRLPELEEYKPADDGSSPLARAEDWVQTTCPQCDAPAKRETDTMPNWAGSCWYFLAFAMNPVPDERNIDADTVHTQFDELMKSTKKWMPVDWYVGGAEHAVLHLLYARFWMHMLHDLGSVEVREPFTKLRNVGMVQAEDGVKMSKSRGNTINPDDVIKEYGADALRVYEMFMAPFDQEIDWSTQSLQGAYRFIKRIWQIYNQPDKIAKVPNKGSKKLSSELQKVILKVDKDIPDVKFNTPIASLMEFLNSWEEKGAVLSEDHARAYLQVLSPFAPFVSEHIWRTIFKENESIHRSTWPNADESLIQESKIDFPVQVDGKLRDTIHVSQDVSEEEAITLAKKSNKIKKWIKDKDVKVVFVPGKILNFITSGLG